MNKDGAIWSEDIFDLHNVQHTDDELELAKEKIISLFYEFDGDFPPRVLPEQGA